MGYEYIEYSKLLYDVTGKCCCAVRSLKYFYTVKSVFIKIKTKTTQIKKFYLKNYLCLN